MAEAFSPYREWLGLAAERPNHYELLSLPVYEEDVEAVALAADRAATRVRGFRPGKNAAAWSRLLDEIHAAKECLLSDHEKVEYDRQLRSGNPPAPVKKKSAASEPGDLYPPGMGPSRAGEAAKGPSASEQSASDLLPPGVARFPVATSPTVAAPANASLGPDEAAALLPPGAAPVSAPYAAGGVPFAAPLAMPLGSPPYPNAYAGAPLGTAPFGAAPLAAPYAQPVNPYAYPAGYPGLAMPATPPPAPPPLHGGYSPGLGSVAAEASAAVAFAPTAGPAALPGQSPTAEVFARPIAKSAPPGISRRDDSSQRMLLVAGAGGGLLLLLAALIVAVVTASGDPAETAQAPPAKNTATTSASAPQPIPRTIESSLPKPANSTPAPPVPPVPAQPPLESPPGPMPAPMPAPFPAPLPEPMTPPSTAPVPTPTPSPTPTPEPTPPSPTPTPAPTPPPTPPPIPAPPPPAITPEDAIALGKALTAAKLALGEQDFEEADKQLAIAQPLVRLPAHNEKFARLKEVADYVKQFRQAIGEAIKGLEVGGTFKVGSSTMVVVVEKSESTLTVRTGGQNITYKLSNLKEGVALALADLYLDAGNPVNRVIKGSYLAVDPKADSDKLQRAKAFWEEAQLAGADVTHLMPFLTDSYEGLDKDIPAASETPAAAAAPANGAP